MNRGLSPKYPHCRTNQGDLDFEHLTSPCRGRPMGDGCQNGCQTCDDVSTAKAAWFSFVDGFRWRLVQDMCVER